MIETTAENCSSALLFHSFYYYRKDLEVHKIIRGTRPPKEPKLKCCTCYDLTRKTSIVTGTGVWVHMQSSTRVAFFGIATAGWVAPHIKFRLQPSPPNNAYSYV